MKKQKITINNPSTTGFEVESAKNFYEALKNDPQAVVKWCEEEIEAYKTLIKLIKKGVNYENNN